MNIKRCMKKSFSVIGKEGSTKDGSDFIKRLWEDANSNFNEVKDIAKKDEDGNILGIWGAMSDFSRSFKVWENGFSEGLYLAGIEVESDAKAPLGWVKWTIPSYNYIYVKRDGLDTFSKVIEYLNKNNIKLAGAVHDFTCPMDGKEYIFFPIEKL